MHKITLKIKISMHIFFKILTINFLLTAYMLSYAGTIHFDEQTKRLKGLRDSVVWLRSKGNEKIKVEWKDWYAGDSTINYIYLQSPHGKLIDRIKIDYGEKRGNKIYQLSHGAGDYRIEFPGYFFRNGSIRVNEKMPMVLEPAKGHLSFHADSSPLYFSVPEKSDSFALCGKYNNGPTKILLYNPNNHLHDELILAQKPPTLHFDCIKVKNPISGTWHIKFSGKGKIAFWLDGIGNYFALKAKELFTPILKAGKVIISNKESITHPMGKIGSQIVNHKSDPRIFDAIRYMKLNSINLYIDHSWREPFNPRFPNGGDNDNPSLINWDGFRWNDQKLDFYRNKLDAQISAIFDSRNSWIGTPLTPEKQEEYAEFIFAYISHVNNIKDYNQRWFSIWDEPNLEKFTFEQYESLVKKVGNRLKDPTNPEKVINTHLLAISSSGFDMTTTEKNRLGMKWAKKIYAVHDQLVDGIAFHYWNIRDLIELWRYDDAVSKARDIILYNDSDDNIDEDIVINQTSMSFGKASSAYDVNTHFGALWLAGAICNAFNSGQLDAFNYFPTVDEKKNMKGLIYSNVLPSPLPYAEKVKDYSIKPIGHSMAMINRNVLDNVITINSDSLEVDALVTIDSDMKSIGIIMVNKFLRTTDVSINLQLPQEMLQKTYLLHIERFGPGEQSPVPHNTNTLHSIDQSLILNKRLDGKSIYAFKLSAK